MLLFVILIASGFIFSMFHFFDIMRECYDELPNFLSNNHFTSSIIASFDNAYNSLYSGQQFSLDIFSFTQRALNKHETRNFEVLKGNNDKLYLNTSGQEISTDELKIVAKECKLLYDASNGYGGHFLYVQVPFKNAGQAPELVDYSGDKTEECEDYLTNLIRNEGVPVLDLRDYNECIEYYKTDHHWTTKAAFNASNIITKEIEHIYDFNFDNHKYYGNINNYYPITYDNCFLGSIGIKVGQYFAGKDPFTVYNPKFETDLVFEHYIDNKLQFKNEGRFFDTFIDKEILEDSKYNNKYNANMYGAYVESVIYNNRANNEYKGLLIAHSYGRPMTQYMCLDYNEFVYLDPQRGRYNDNLIDYIKDYQPDVVIYMFNEIANVADGNWDNN